ncbi:LysR family transcriptional regulator [Glaciimonas sp. PCH181]|uniref:LysR family transcriptional regulator n=1 Tax=Glaciimonas sp. PCH181 TaxID=2133943 RepID=UPI000D38D51E|nr:LysR family transcriptional regulator [Glaciimonas sp. PCH181]PUA16928.1 LysR family transcriptional regulator [Glaciimonas sp. PCH181]
MRRNFPSLSALIAFEVVYRLQSISAAAIELSLTQSAVSKKMLALEDFFQQPLFERHSFGLNRTIAAELLWARLPRCLDELEGVMLEVLASRHGGGVLNLSVIPTFATKWLMPRLPRLKDAYPDLTINLSIQIDRFEFTGSGQDAGIVFGQPDLWPHCEHHLIAEERQVVVCSPDFIKRNKRPKRPQDIANFTLIHSTSRPYAWPHWFENHDIAITTDIPGPRFELFSMAAEAAKAGIGVALLPEMFVSDELKRRSLIKLFPSEKQVDGAYYFVYPHRKATIPGLISFQHWLLAEANIA